MGGNLLAANTFLKCWQPYNAPLPWISHCSAQGYSVDFVKELRGALDSAGFRDTYLYCGDDSRTFHCSQDVLNDPALASIVRALGSHNPTGNDPVADRTGKSLWGTELEAGDLGGTDLAVDFARLYSAVNVGADEIMRVPCVAMN